MQREQASTGDRGQYLTFRVGGELYAIDILRVHEIKGLSPVTVIPHAPRFVKGVMNLRGTVVPVVGLRERFGMPPLVDDKFAVIVLVKSQSRIVGLVVDAVSDVLRIDPGSIEPIPELTRHVDTSFVAGMAKTDESLVIVLDVDGVVGSAVCATPEANQPRAAEERR
jgi:purine-binding chemotaxis protein CheW